MTSPLYWSVQTSNHTGVFTGSIARSASRRYLIYSEAGFEVFAPHGRHVAPMGVKFGTASVPNFIPIGATTRV